MTEAGASLVSQESNPNDEISHDQQKPSVDNDRGMNSEFRMESYTERAKRRGFLLTLQEFLYPEMQRIPLGRFVILFFFAAIP